MAAAITANLIAAIDPPLNSTPTLPANALPAPQSSFGSVLVQIQNRTAPTAAAPTATTTDATATTDAIETTETVTIGDEELFEAVVEATDEENLALASALFATNLFAANTVAANVQPTPTPLVATSEDATAANRTPAVGAESRTEELRFTQAPASRGASVERTATVPTDATAVANEPTAVRPVVARTLETASSTPTPTGTTANTPADLPRAAAAPPSVLPQSAIPLDRSQVLPQAVPNIGYGNIRPTVSATTGIPATPTVNPGGRTANNLPAEALPAVPAPSTPEVPVPFAIALAEAKPATLENATPTVNPATPTAPTPVAVTPPPTTLVRDVQPDVRPESALPLPIRTAPVPVAPPLATANPAAPVVVQASSTTVAPTVPSSTPVIAPTVQASPPVVTPIVPTTTTAVPTPTTAVPTPVVTAPVAQLPTNAAAVPPVVDPKAIPIRLEPARSIVTQSQPTPGVFTAVETEPVRSIPRAIGGVSPADSSVEIYRLDDTTLPVAPIVVPTVPTAVPPAMPTVSAPLAEQLQSSIVTHASMIETRPGEIEFQMRLDPKELGPVKIRLTATGDSLRAEVVVADESVRKMVEQQLPELRQRLESSGVSVSRFDVTAENPNTAGGRGEGESRRREQPPQTPFAPTPAVVAARFQRTAPTRVGALDVTA